MKWGQFLDRQHWQPHSPALPGLGKQRLDLAMERWLYWTENENGRGDLLILVCLI